MINKTGRMKEHVQLPSINGMTDVVPPKAFTPVGDLVALHMHPVTENEVGILLPDGSENPKQTNLCTVVAAGPLCKQVKDGDKVFIHQALATIISHKGYKYIVIEEKLIAGVLNEGE